MILKLRRRLVILPVLLFVIAAIAIVKVHSSEAVAIHALAIEAAVTLHTPSSSEAATALDPASVQEQLPITDKAPEPLLPPPSRQLRVVLDWYPTPYHAPLIVARERDLFDREGLDVSLITPADPSVSSKLVAAQRVELALTSQPQLHFLIEQGLPLTHVGTLVPAPLATLMTRQDKGIERLEHLKGKTIGYVHEGPARMWLDALFRDQPITLEDVTLRHIDFALISALVDSEVDAIIGTMRHVDKQQLAQQGIEAIEFMVEENDLPAYDELIVVANRDVLNRHRRDIAGFLKAVEKATLWLINHPDQGWELLRKVEPGLDTPANARAWPNVLRYLALRPLVLQRQRYQRLETYLLRRGLIETPTSIERLAWDIDSEPPRATRNGASTNG